MHAKLSCKVESARLTIASFLWVWQLPRVVHSTPGDYFSRTFYVHPVHFITDTSTFQLVQSFMICLIWTSPVHYLSLSISCLISHVPDISISFNQVRIQLKKDILWQEMLNFTCKVGSCLLVMQVFRRRTTWLPQLSFNIQRKSSPLVCLSVNFFPK